MSRSFDSIQLLIVDPQNDFCDLPPDWHAVNPATRAPIAPSLPVSGAHADMQRLAQFIRRQGPHIERITVTLDSHQRIDIAHPGFWQGGDGSDVAPFTPITAAQVLAAEFLPRDPGTLPRVLDYLHALESLGRYTLMVWPVHCEIGSWGHGIHADVLAACDDWQLREQRAVRNVFKGMNPWTENYSAIQAEVPDPQDPDTMLNTRLLQVLASSDRLLIAGEASSHCVRATTEHILRFLPEITPDWTPARITLLTDCMSPVSGFEREHAAFVQSMHTQGVQLAQSSELSL